jgi:hypothetical protein
MSVNDIQEGFLWCRDVLHSWDPYDFRVSRNAVTRRNEMNQILRCARCGTIKTRIMTTQGDLLRNSYSYPDGYLLKDHGPLTPADRAMIRRMNIAKASKIE